MITGTFLIREKGAIPSTRPDADHTLTRSSPGPRHPLPEAKEKKNGNVLTPEEVSRKSLLSQEIRPLSLGIQKLILLVEAHMSPPFYR